MDTVNESMSFILENEYLILIDLTKRLYSFSFSFMRCLLFLFLKILFAFNEFLSLELGFLIFS